MKHLYQTKAEVQAKDKNNRLEWFETITEANHMACQYDKPVYSTFDNKYFVVKPIIQELIPEEVDIQLPLF